MTITPGSDFVHLVAFMVILAAGSVKDKGSNDFAGIRGTLYQLNTDLTPPTLASCSPSEGSVVAVEINAVLTFSENVQSRSGNIVLTPSSGLPVNIGSTDGQVSSGVLSEADLPGEKFIDLPGSGVSPEGHAGPRKYQTGTLQWAYTTLSGKIVQKMPQKFTCETYILHDKDVCFFLL